VDRLAGRKRCHRLPRQSVELYHVGDPIAIDSE
jgi:hypothetical protein